MRKTLSLIIVVLMTLQISLYGLDSFEEPTQDKLIQSDDSEVQFAGRQSSGIHGNSSSNTTDCGFQGSADGLGGPLWDNNTNYTAYSIVEWPANSGEFYQTQINSSGGSVQESHWKGPCTCVQIAQISGISWNSAGGYSPWQILTHNGSIWMAMDAGSNAGEEPGTVGTEDIWIPCTDGGTAPCADVVGTPTSVWDSNTLVSEGDIYEYPANSGNFHLVVGIGMTNQTVGAPGVDFDAWGSEVCTCKNIWADSGQPVWDSTVNYPLNSVVEWPAGSSALYIAWASPGPGAQPDVDAKWRLCDGQPPSGSPCEDFNGYGGLPWYNTTLVSAGEIYEIPAGSGHFYQVSPGINNQTVGAPAVDLDAWSNKHCACEDIWLTSSSPVWNSSTVYSVGMIVEYPTGTGSLWMAVVNQTTTGVTPDQPFADGNQWQLCGGASNVSTGPCGGLTSIGVWDNLSRVSTGEIYEFPANSEMYYEVIIQGYLDQQVSSPLIDLDVWAPVSCPCDEEWISLGQPVWNSTMTYSPNAVVEWPAGSSMLYIASPSPGPGDEPGSDPEWVLCSSPDEPSGSPCAGLNVVGVWNSTMNVTSGEIYEYPANSGTYYVVNAGSPFWSVNAPDVDMDVWSSIDCPCKETWVANGQPVWTSGIAYAGNYVVEWPASSGILYMSESGGLTNGAGEPGVDGHWTLCDGQPMPSNPCAGLDSAGVWDNMTGVTSGEIYEFPAGSGTYYEVVIANYSNQTTNAPDVDMDVWALKDCPCKETWVANGQPVWAAGTAYAGNYVVEWPANSGNLYISEAGGLTNQAGEPGVDVGHWMLCSGQPIPSNPCAGLNSVGVWTNMTGVSTGEIYEFPAGSGTFYEVVIGNYTNQTTNAPNVDLDVWALKDCPCKETWVANGQPVWAAGTAYAGNYVVEWPANSGNLYISEAGGLTNQAGEPGVDVGHWMQCDGDMVDADMDGTPDADADSDEDSDAAIPALGMMATMLSVLTAGVLFQRTSREQ